MKKCKILIFILLLLVVTGCANSKNETVINDINTDTNENATTNSSSVNSILASNSDQETTIKSEATIELEFNYDDIQIEYARVIANLGVENKIGYTLERVISNQVAFDTSVSDKYKNIHIKEIGTEDRYIYYLPLGEGFIEHYGMRKYPPDPTMSPAKTYLKTDYDDIALELLKNQNNVSDNDLNIEAINNSDFTSLAGTWKNGKGDVLIINADGTTNKEFVVYGVPESDKKSKIPFARLGTEGLGGAALALYGIGVENPDGDNSDSTIPRLLITQQGGNYPSDVYYYKQ
ncbi:DUF6287 domain-containing protein [Enterococcus ureasiticus]|uniref:DUF6287 domain-containing protein n=1 Tax=Enterococcus ureasiticus TaxID=903984 RepID=A0A1E5GDS7_9ENTE|nr:DUF6287 domain-containing protein [Enterococcus ureasiticus]OEG10839.1 hypothetical protein BCR21_11130 [Enterococcus ureasiticus]